MSPFPRLRRSTTRSSDITISSPKPSSLSCSSSTSRRTDQKMSYGRGGAGNINEEEDDDNPGLPVTTIANNVQENDERIGVGRGGTGNFKRPPLASRFLPGHPPDSGTRSNASRGSASSCHQSATSDARPYSPSRPSNGSFATGRSVQPIPHATTHRAGESTMPSSTAVAQFRFDFTESDNEHSSIVNQRSKFLPGGSDIKTRGALRQRQRDGENYRNYEDHHSLEPLSATKSSTMDSNNNFSAAPFPASVTTSRRIFSATQPKPAPIELTALPQVQPTNPPPPMSPIPFQPSSPTSPKSASPGNADPTHLFLPSTAIARDEKFVYGRGGFANITRESDGMIRQHRSLVDYLASKRKKGSSSASNKGNAYDHSDANIDAGERKKSWWRKGKAGHQHIIT